MMNGVFPEIAKKQRFVFRKMRLEDGNLVRCPCVDPLTEEPDKDTFCPVCLGEAYLWDESSVDGYKVVIRHPVGLSSKETLIQPGNVNLAYVSFYFQYNLSINLFPKQVSPDKVVELVTNTNGTPTRPYQRERIYRIGTAIDFRSDDGRVEYWKLDCYEEQVKFLNGPEG